MLQQVERYQNLLHGAELVESQLKSSFTEYLNAEIVLRTVKDVSMAVAWLKGSFFYIRVRTCSCSCVDLRGTISPYMQPAWCHAGQLNHIPCFVH